MQKNDQPVHVTLTRNYAKPGKALRKGATIAVTPEEAQRLKTMNIAQDATSEEVTRMNDKQQRDAQGKQALPGAQAQPQRQTPPPAVNPNVQKQEAK